MRIHVGKSHRLWLVGGVLLAALVGIAVHELVKPLLWGVGLAIALAAMVGARELAQRLMGWWLGLVVIAVVWPAFSTEIRRTCRLLWADPQVRLLVLVIVVVLIAVVVLVVLAKTWAAHPKVATPLRPTARMRVPVTTPEPLPAFSDSGRSPTTSDDLHLFAEQSHDKS